MLPKPAFVLADPHAGLPWVAWQSLPSAHKALEERDQDPLFLYQSTQARTHLLSA